MLSADAFRGAMTAAVAELERRLGSAPEVSLQIESDRDEWRIDVTPSSPAACAFEAVVRADGRMDCRIDDLACEAVALDNPRDLVSLLTAIRDGRIRVRTWRHPASGRQLGAQAVVVRSEGEPWVMGEVSAAHRAEGVRVERHFAPYSRTN
jgi:hypothetical protein